MTRFACAIVGAFLGVYAAAAPPPAPKGHGGGTAPGVRPFGGAERAWSHRRHGLPEWAVESFESGDKNTHVGCIGRAIVVSSARGTVKRGPRNFKTMPVGFDLFRVANGRWEQIDLTKLEATHETKGRRITSALPFPAGSLVLLHVTDEDLETRHMIGDAATGKIVAEAEIAAKMRPGDRLMLEPVLSANGRFVSAWVKPDDRRPSETLLIDLKTSEVRRIDDVMISPKWISDEGRILFGSTGNESFAVHVFGKGVVFPEPGSPLKIREGAFWPESDGKHAWVAADDPAGKGTLFRIALTDGKRLASRPIPPTPPGTSSLSAIPFLSGRLWAFPDEAPSEKKAAQDTTAQWTLVDSATGSIVGRGAGPVGSLEAGCPAPPGRHLFRGTEQRGEDGDFETTVSVVDTEALLRNLVKVPRTRRSVAEIATDLRANDAAVANRAMLEARSVRASAAELRDRKYEGRAATKADGVWLAGLAERFASPDHAVRSAASREALARIAELSEPAYRETFLPVIAKLAAERDREVAQRARDLIEWWRMRGRAPTGVVADRLDGVSSISDK